MCKVKAEFVGHLFSEYVFFSRNLLFIDESFYVGLFVGW